LEKGEIMLKIRIIASKTPEKSGFACLKTIQFIAV
jgi:hypothetical protein